MVGSSLGVEIDTDSRHTQQALFVGSIDLAIVALLVLLGRIHHGYGLLEQPIATLETMVPFVLGWLTVGVLAGAYARGVFQSPALAARVTIVAWVGAANVGLILRSSELFVGGAAWPFNLVMTGLGIVVLVLWRVVFALVNRS